jgi:hypothetical protein
VYEVSPLATGLFLIAIFAILWKFCKSTADVTFKDGGQFVKSMLEDATMREVIRKHGNSHNARK